MADIFTVIADPTRRDLLLLLLGGAEAAELENEAEASEFAVSELVAELGLSQPTVSKHLKVLREAGLVSVREEGQHRYYKLEADPLEEVEDWIIPFLTLGFDGDELDDDLDDEADLVFASDDDTVQIAGETVGRKLAEVVHQTRTVSEGASRGVAKVLNSLGIK